MKTIGLLGGMSWESSIHYERLINEAVRERLGGLHSADLIIRSYDFDSIARLQAAGAWAQAGELLAADARRLADGGAEVIILCTNTMHRVADAIVAEVGSRFVHIADATAAAVRAADCGRVGLLGTRYTTEGAFYAGRLGSHGLDVRVPTAGERTVVHDIIYDELVRGVIEPESRHRYLEVIGRLVADGAEGIIAGCTEIELLVGPDDVDVPYFPTTTIHALAAVDAALG